LNTFHSPASSPHFRVVASISRSFALFARARVVVARRVVVASRARVDRSPRARRAVAVAIRVVAIRVAAIRVVGRRGRRAARVIARGAPARVVVAIVARARRRATAARARSRDRAPRRGDAADT